LTAVGGDRIVGGFGAVRRTSANASLLGSTNPRLEHASVVIGPNVVGTSPVEAVAKTRKEKTRG
jgi:hypothetical protein